MLDIRIEKASTLKERPTGDLGFGRIFTDHMFLMDYQEGKGWLDARIVPYGDFTFSPACAVFHYGQEMFEGMKAYRNAAGEVRLFRPEMNAERLNISNDRLCIPEIPVEDFMQALTTLLDLDRDWVPTQAGTSLYIRPFVFATEPYLGVAPSKNFRFAIIMSPSGLYYSKGLEPVDIWVEDQYVRAVCGGVGFAKTGGNYAASLKAQREAYAAGYDQVLWLDGIERKYIEEVGSMNVFFKIDGEVVTPEICTSILAGITRDSVIELCKKWGLPVVERRITIDELIEAQRKGTLEEAFGTGTAAVITPIGKFQYKGQVLQVADGTTGELSKKIYDVLTGIQYGEREDNFGWSVRI